jgi:hypothetical protein
MAVEAIQLVRAAELVRMYEEKQYPHIAKEFIYDLLELAEEYKKQLGA